MGDWGFVLRVGTTTVIEPIDPFPISLHFVATHSIQTFMQGSDLEELETLEMVVTGIYGKDLYLGCGR
jgi:hypothetical protein